MIELMKKINNIIYKINDKLNIHTKLIDPRVNSFHSTLNHL